MPRSSRGGTRVSSGLIARQVGELLEERKEKQGWERLALSTSQISRDSYTDPVLSVVFFLPFVDRQSLRLPVDGFGGAGREFHKTSNAAGATSLGWSSVLRAREHVFLYHSWSSRGPGLLFQDFITTYSARGLAAVFTETGAHWAPDLRRARTSRPHGWTCNF